jgi:hypothetical protein
MHTQVVAGRSELSNSYGTYISNCTKAFRTGMGYVTAVGAQFESVVFRRKMLGRYVWNHLTPGQAGGMMMRALQKPFLLRQTADNQAVPGQRGGIPSEAGFWCKPSRCLA